MALAKKHQMDGSSQPLSLIIMYTPDGFQASRDEMYLRGRAIQLGQTFSEGASTIEAIEYVGRKLMEEGLGDVDMDDEVVGMLQGQGFETLVSLPVGEIVVAYHNLIRRTAGAKSWTHPREVGQCQITPFLPSLLEVTQLPMSVNTVTNGESYQSGESTLRDDVACHIERPENWEEISILSFFNSAFPKNSQVTGLKSQPIIRIMSTRDPKLSWRGASDNDEVRGEEVFASNPGGKSYVRHDTDLRVLFELRPDKMCEMKLGQLASEYRLLIKNCREAESVRGKIDDQTGLGPDSTSLVAGTERTLAPQAMMMKNGRVMLRRSQETRAVINLLHHGTTSAYTNFLLWSTWQRLEEIGTTQDEEETPAQKETRLSIYPMSMFPFLEEDN